MNGDKKLRLMEEKTGTAVKNKQSYKVMNLYLAHACVPHSHDAHTIQPESCMLHPTTAKPCARDVNAWIWLYYCDMKLYKSLWCISDILTTVVCSFHKTTFTYIYDFLLVSSVYTFLIAQYYFPGSGDDYNGMNERMLGNTIAYEFYSLVNVQNSRRMLYVSNI